MAKAQPISQEKINRDLANQDTGGNWQAELVDILNQYVRDSSNRMSRYWPVWREQQIVYNTYITQEQNDKHNQIDILLKRPSQIIVPTSYAQVQTMMSFLLSIFFQKKYFFDLKGRGPEDDEVKEGMMYDLQFQLDKNDFYLKMYNFLLYALRNNLGVMKVMWGTKKEKVRARKEIPISQLQSKINSLVGKETSSKFEEVVIDMLSYEGALLQDIRPYQFFPDPNFHIHRFQDGSYCATEEYFSRASIQSQEGDEYFGTQYIPENDFLWGEDYIPSDLKHHYNNLEQNNHGTKGHNKVFLREIVFEFIPAEWSEKTGLPFGTSRQIEKWYAVIANGRKLIKLEPYGALHGKFPYVVGQYSIDPEEFIGQGLSQRIHALQWMVNWFYNTHVKNVSQFLNNKYLYNPKYIDRQDVESNQQGIRIKESPLPVDQIFKQLQVFDVTKQHTAEMDLLNSVIQQVTGISDNALGQFNSGRRSAREAGLVNSSVVARMTMHAQMLWQQGMKAMGEMMMANTRQSRSEEFYNQILGNNAEKYPYDRVILADPQRIAGGFDFAQFDATMPSQRFIQASKLTEMMQLGLNAPQIFAGPDGTLDFKKLYFHIMELYDVQNGEQFITREPVVVDNAMAQQANDAGLPVGDAFLQGPK